MKQLEVIVRISSTAHQIRHIDTLSGHVRVSFELKVLLNLIELLTEKRCFAMCLRNGARPPHRHCELRVPDSIGSRMRKGTFTTRIVRGNRFILAGNVEKCKTSSVISGCIHTGTV